MTVQPLKNTTTQDQLRAYVSRVERLEEERKAMSEDISAVFQEAKSNGYDVKALKSIIKIRKTDPSELAEQDALIDIYKQALGMI